VKTYGWNAVKLSDAYSLEELYELRKSITEDPSNANSDGSIYLYTKAARKKLDAIGYAVSYKIKERLTSLA
jgi:hypothetical protein